VQLIIVVFLQLIFLNANFQFYGRIVLKIVLNFYHPSSSYYHTAQVQQFQVILVTLHNMAPFASTILLPADANVYGTGEQAPSDLKPRTYYAYLTCEAFAFVRH
jgi:hypothetical protein